MNCAFDRERTLSPFFSIIPAVLVAFMIAGCFIITSDDDSTADNPTSGTCGTSLEWSIEPSTGALTITGSGDMQDFTSSAVRLLL